MYYATHALSPILTLAGTRAKAVHCFGSGAMRTELQAQYNNPFPVETAIFELEGESTLAAEVIRTLFQTARSYVESFSVFGDKGSFEWEQIEGENPIKFSLTTRISDPGSVNVIKMERVEVPDRQDLLPKEIVRFTKRGVYDETDEHLSFMQGGGHDGSHPHLIHEFVSSIVEGRQPRPDIITTANWNAAGFVPTNQL